MLYGEADFGGPERWRLSSSQLSRNPLARIIARFLIKLVILQAMPAQLQAIAPLWPVSMIWSVLEPVAGTGTRAAGASGRLFVTKDANGHATSWTYDLQGRTTSKVDADGPATTFSYESTTSRLKSQTDAKNQTTSFTYFPDSRVKQMTHTGGTVLTPDVSFTYENVYARVKTRTDGTGTTTYTYNPVNGQLGSGRLASVDGPWSNDTTTYNYDEVGRVVSRAINGVASTVAYDNLKRPSSTTNALGTFNYGFDGVTGRLLNITSSSGPSQIFSYFNNAGDRRMSRIQNLANGSGATLSQFDYTYNTNGQIATWTQQLGSDPAAAKAYTFGYDSVNRLTSAILKNTAAPQSLIHNYAYGYDAAGNRTAEQIDGALTASSYNQDNEQASVGGAGNLQVRGTTNEPASVSLQGATVPQATDNSFAGTVPVGSGTNNFTVQAKDYSGNTRTNTYQVAVNGTVGTLTYDPNGNLQSDGQRTFTWDAENRLVAIDQGSHRAEMVYDGLSRRVEIIEKDNGAVTSDKKYLWVGRAIAEERDATGATVTKRFFGQGFQQGSNTYFYTRDHLGSIREVSDAAGAVRARYDYDPWGRRTKLSGDVDADFGYAGYFEHAPSGLKLTKHRAYDANLGRWLSRDPIGFLGGSNLYRYVGDDPVNRVDPLGLCEEKGDLERFVDGVAIGAGIAVGIALIPEEAVALTTVVAILGLAMAEQAVEDLLDPQVSAGDKWEIAGGFVGGIGTGWLLSPGSAPQGMNDPAVADAVAMGNRVHYDQMNGGSGRQLPTALSEQYPETEFRFARRGEAGADVEVVGGRHPSTYPGSMWEPGNDFADFKPDTPSGMTKFGQSIRNGTLPKNTQCLRYNPNTGNPAW